MTPATEAGRALVTLLGPLTDYDENLWMDRALANGIAAIEAEATAAYRRDLAERVRGLGECGFHEPHEPHEYVVARNDRPLDLPCPGFPFAAVLSLIEG
jgi:hypothetical protein